MKRATILRAVGSSNNPYAERYRNWDAEYAGLGGVMWGRLDAVTVADNKAAALLDVGGGSGTWANSTAGARPQYFSEGGVNGLPFARFDGSDDSLLNTFTLANSTAFTGLLVATPLDDANDFWLGDNGGPRVVTRNTAGRFRTAFGDGAAQAVSSSPIGSLAAVLFSFDGASKIDLRVSGQGLITSTAGTVPAGTAGFSICPTVARPNFDLYELRLLPWLEGSADGSRREIVRKYVQFRYGLILP